jgi:hypothetical protein
MIGKALALFDAVIGGIFTNLVTEKVKSALDRRNVDQALRRCAEAPAQAMESYFRNERISERVADLIILEVQRAVEASAVSAASLASASLNAEKLTERLLASYDMPESIEEEGMEWPFRMAVQITAEALCNIGPRFAEWEREAWRRSFDSFDRLLENQERILSYVGPSSEGTLDERFAHTYRSHVLRRLAQIDAATCRPSSSLFLDLTTVFVEPDIIEGDATQRKRRVRKKVRQMDVAITSLEEARRQMLSEEENSSRGRVHAQQFVASKKRCALIGLPGTGKTTLLQHLLLSIASERLKLSKRSSQHIPILLRARELNPDALPPPAEILEAAEGSVIAGARPGFIERQLASGAGVLLIDGLDEVPLAKRDKFLAWFRDVVEVYPDARYVVSSRPSGYNSQFFRSLAFAEAELCEFTHDQMREYVRKWSMAVALANGATEAEAQEAGSEDANTLVGRAERNPYVRQIATNPLMLSTLCLVQRYEGGDLPNRRTTLYQRCAEGLLFHWDNKRSLSPAVVGSLTLERKMHLLRRLALQMQVQGIAEMEARKVSRSFSTSLRTTGESIQARVVLENIKDRSGLLTERRSGVYGYSHLTFQEYFAALSVNEGDFKTYDRFFLFSKRADPQWAEVIALYAGVAPRDAVQNLLEELLKTERPANIMLAAECLACSRDSRIETQKQVLSALLRLPMSIDGEFPFGGFRVQRLLEGLDPRIVTEQAAACLDDLSTIHAVRYLFFALPDAAIPALAKVGARVLHGEQEPAEWDFAISLIMALIPSSKAALALGSLVDAVSEATPTEALRVLHGIWTRDMYSRYRQEKLHPEDGELPGVFAILTWKSHAAEKVALCRYLAVAANTQASDSLPRDEKRFQPYGLEPLTGQLNDLAATGPITVRKAASQALAAIGPLVKAMRRMERSRSRQRKSRARAQKPSSQQQPERDK